MIMEREVERNKGDLPFILCRGEHENPSDLDKEHSHGCHCRADSQCTSPPGEPGSFSPCRDPITFRCLRVRREKFKRTSSDVSKHASPTSVLTWNGDILPHSPQREDSGLRIRRLTPLSPLSPPLSSFPGSNAGTPSPVLGPRRLSLDSQDLRMASQAQHSNVVGKATQEERLRQSSMDRLALLGFQAAQQHSKQSPHLQQGSRDVRESNAVALMEEDKDGSMDTIGYEGDSLQRSVSSPVTATLPDEDMREDCMMDRVASDPSLRVSKPLTEDQPSGTTAQEGFQCLSTFSLVSPSANRSKEESKLELPMPQMSLTDRKTAASAALPIHPLPSKLDPNHVLSSQLSPTLTALLEVISGGAHVEAEASASSETFSQRVSFKQRGIIHPRRHSRAPRIQSSLATLLEELTCEPESPSSCTSSGCNSILGSISSENCAFSQGDTTEQPTEASVNERPNPTLNALLSILAVEPDEDDDSAGPRSSRSISSAAGDVLQPVRSKPEVPCALDSFMLSPRGLVRQSSLDSGKDTQRANAGTDPSSLHGSPACSPKHKESPSLVSPQHESPSPVLQRRLTGHRVTVVGECWQAGVHRGSKDEGSFGMRSVLEILEQEGTASFYRGFNVASPQHESMKRSKRM